MRGEPDTHGKRMQFEYTFRRIKIEGKNSSVFLGDNNIYPKGMVDENI